MRNFLHLRGDAHVRGRGQAALRPDAAAAVRDALAARLETIRIDRDFIDRQHAFAQAHCAGDMAEIDGIAQGYAVDPLDLFIYLHAGILGDLGAYQGDGCSVLAMPHPQGGARIAKNRDFRGDHAPLQMVALHEGPDMPHAWLSLGSLGAPGAYSSGINDAGLAVADTQTSVRNHAPGWLRYFVMTRILSVCADVKAAVAMLRELRHVGGGCLVLADRQGVTAAVELACNGIAVEWGDRSVARTNHFVQLADENLVRSGDCMQASSQERLERLRAALESGMGCNPQALMASHGGDGRPALCRHGEDDDAHTLSLACLETGAPALSVAFGPPCMQPLQRFAFATLANGDGAGR